MTPTVVFAPILPNGTPQADYTQLTVHVHARIISAARARQIANGWLLWNMGERIAVGEPELILDEKIVWRFPLRWTSSKQGVLADLTIGLCVDALSGEILATESTSAEIHHRVQSVARTVQITTN